jgi:hypothetical protein
MANLLESSGSRDEKQTRFAAIYTPRFFFGLQTDRNKLRGPGGVIYDTYYKIGTTDALLGGVNTEVSKRLTIIRRPGNTAGLTDVISSSTIPDIIDSFYSFEEITGSLRLFASGASSVWLLSSSGNHIPIYTKNAAPITMSGNFFGTGIAIVNANNNFQAGQLVTISGSTNGGGSLNGTWQIYLANSTQFQFVFNGPVFSFAADTGTASVAGQTYFQGVNTSLYFSDRASVPQKWQDFGLGNPGNSLSPIVFTSITNNQATIVCTNNFQVGQTVVVSNTTNGGGVFNGTWTIIYANPFGFIFNITHADVGSASETGAWASATWNLGIVAPTTAPTLNIVASGAAATQWVANTVFSTMGLIVDPNGNAQQIISVNASGTNTTQLGTTSNGQPNWNQTPGGTTSDGSITWTNWGPIPAWAAHTVYNNAGVGGTAANPSQVYDPASKVVAINVNQSLAQGTSGGTKPNFKAIQASIIHDPSNQGSPPGVKWYSIFPAPTFWKPSTAYPAFLGTDTAATCIIEPTGLPAGTNQTVYLQISNGGTSGASGTAPAFATVAGQQTTDNDIIWLCMGSATRTNSTAYTAYTGTSPVFSVIKVSTNLFVCTTSGVSAGSAPTFSTGYGDTTVDGTCVWTCVGPSLAWAASTQWYLPISGFAPPTGAQPYGGAEVIGAGFVQAVIASGKSGSSTPSWSTTVGNTTTDGAITWTNISAFSQNSLAWQTGYKYAYSYKARSVSDTYSPIPAGGGLLPPGNPALTTPTVTPYGSQIPGVGLGTPTGSADGTVSTASPIVAMATGANAGSVVYVSGIGSTDPQVDTIVIFRTADGGSTFYELTEIPNPAPNGGNPSPWTFADFLPDIANANYPGLNTLVLAPLADFSDPPLTGAINLAYHLGRLWYSVGATVYASDGPLVGGSTQPPGNGFTQFNPAQFFSFPSPSVRLVPSNTGLFNFGKSDVYSITGGPSFSTLAPSVYVPGLGISSYNALAQQKGLIYVVSSDKVLLSLDPNQGISETGSPIGDIIQSLDPSAVYLTFLSEGSDDRALFLGDGSTGWYRCNPNPSPDVSISGPLWSPKANIVGGAKAVAALQVAEGQNALVMGATTSGQPILVRDSTFTTFTDNGSSYPSYYIFGSIVLAYPGQIAQIGFITCDFIKTGSSPKLAVMLDEITDSVFSISAAAKSGQNTTYTYTVTSGPAAQTDMIVTITGMADAGNNGTFEIISTGVNTFTVVNANGVNRTGQTGTSTRFIDLSAYVSGMTGLPPQESPSIYGLVSSPASLYSNRYYMEQSVNGFAPPSYCRHLQIRVDYGSTDTVQNEILTQTIFGAHYNEL